MKTTTTILTVILLTVNAALMAQSLSNPSATYPLENGIRNVKMKNGIQYSIDHLLDKTKIFTTTSPGLHIPDKSKAAADMRVESLTELYDSLYEWNWSTYHSGGWALYEKYNDIVYDVHNNLLSLTGDTLNGAAWSLHDRAIYTYNAGNKPTSGLTQLWVDSAWSPEYHVVYNYDANDNPVSFIDSSWFYGVFSFETDTETYDAYHNVLTETDTGWYQGIAYYTYKASYTYDVNNNETSAWDSSSYYGSLTVDKIIYAYNVANKLMGNLDSTWLNGSLTNINRDTTIYDFHNNDIKDLDVSLQPDSMWENNWQYLYTYDANNNLLNDLYQTWNNISWVNQEQQGFTYDVNNITVSSEFKEWNTTGASVTGGDSIIYYYHTVTGIPEYANKSLVYSIYPNPTNGRVTINSSAIKELVVYNLLGEQLCHLNTEQMNEPVIDLSAEPAGIYFLKIYTNSESVIMEKIMKE